MCLVRRLLGQNRANGHAWNQGMAEHVQLTNARIGYETAVSLWVEGAQMLWARYSAMMVANSIIAAAVAIFLTGRVDDADGSVKWWILIVLSMTGTLISIFWLSMFGRDSDYNNYYILSARELEEQHLSNSVRTVARGSDFGRGESLILQLGGKPVCVRMGWWGRRARAYRLAQLIVVVFLVLDILLFAFSLGRLTGIIS